MRVKERGGPLVGVSVGTSVVKDAGVAVMVKGAPEIGTMEVGFWFEAETLPVKAKAIVSAGRIRVRG
jgi:hypothetical protein